jgi:inhibitor of cysteine peptidase
MFKRLVGLLAVLLIIATGGWALAVSEDVSPDSGKGSDPLPVVGSRENLEKLLEKAQDKASQPFGIRLFDRGFGVAMVAEDAAVAAGSAAAPGSAPPEAEDYSGTNVQVAGVDEADLVKTDGKYIYQVNRGRVVIVNADPQQMKVESILDFEDSFQPLELYVDEQYLVVIGNHYPPPPVLEPGPVKPGPIEPDRGFATPDMRVIYPPYYAQSMVKAVVYDHRDKADLKKVREVEVDGNYVSSRKIDDALYLVTNRYLGYHIMNEAEPAILPGYRDSVAGDGRRTLDYGEIRYFPDFYNPNYLLVAGFNLAEPDEIVQVDAYLGAGEEIYASRDNLYVAVTSYQPRRGLLGQNQDQETWVYKFALLDGKIDYQGYGTVPGRILNQFSMDEYNGHFRIATTTGDMWREDEGTSKNNLYILNDQLDLVGSIEGIAPGERIYSVRFMGDRAYMVTFKKVDPLFVLDLKDPAQPQVLGALKIPGYSDYLHPYDENYLIGFGKDTVEVSHKDHLGRVVGSTAYYQGMKVALFDVTDVSNPKELFVEIIGDRGTESELLHNHRALLFSREKELLAFPVTVMEVKDKANSFEDRAIQYGEFAFQGAYVYRLNPEQGFQLRGKISHLTEEDYAKAGNYWYGSESNVERILYIGDHLYTLSQGKIMVHTITGLNHLNTLNIPSSK